MARKQSDEATETAILTKSARRCALCFGLHGDLARVRGQIAHVDRDPGNDAESNLCYLCLPHHEEYDSTSKQVKGFKPSELLVYKAMLERAIANGEHTMQFVLLNEQQRSRQSQLEHDQNLFVKIDSIMDEALLRNFVDGVETDHSYHSSHIRPIDHANEVLKLASNSFIDAEIERVKLELKSAISAMQMFLAYNFFVYPKSQAGNDVRLCLYPDLNWDRGIPSSPNGPQLYDKYAEELNGVLEKVVEAYRTFRLVVKTRLFI